jgi:hypothetical protein
MDAEMLGPVDTGKELYRFTKAARVRSQTEFWSATQPSDPSAPGHASPGPNSWNRCERNKRLWWTNGGAQWGSSPDSDGDGGVGKILVGCFEKYRKADEMFGQIKACLDGCERLVASGHGLTQGLTADRSS